LAHFEQIESFSFSTEQYNVSWTNQSTGFLWEIRPNFYDWFGFLVQHMKQRHESPSKHPQLHVNHVRHYRSNVAWRSEMQPFDGKRPFDQGCLYVNINITRDMHQMIQNIFDRILHSSSSRDDHSFNHSSVALPKPWIGYFHVRRGDTVAICNTTLERMEQYLTCSVGHSLSILAKLKRKERRPKRQVILLVSSDERNPAYRKSLARLVEQQELYPNVSTAFQVSFADLDELGRSEISKAIQQGRMPSWNLNNLYLFRLIAYLEWKRPEITFRLQQRREFCPTCTNISYYILRNPALLE
jgi:hypothetical protein